MQLLPLALLFTSLSAAGQQKQSVLWQVSGKGLPRPSYLFGTVHTLSPALLDRFPLKRYLRQAQVGIFEVTGSPIAPASPTTANIPQRAQPPLDSLFSKPDYALVDSFFSASPLGSIKAHNADADLGGMVQAAIMLKSRPTTEPISLDASIAWRMSQLGKSLFRLDAADDPDRRKFATSYTLLAKTLVSFIKAKDASEYSPLSNEERAAYEEHLTADLMLDQEATGLLREMTVRRNLAWYPQLEHKMQQGPCFIAVGLGHLQYRTGLIQLLRRMGYKVKPVNLPGSK